MLTQLCIRDFVIVDQLNLEFGEGLSVLSGETGAGKSILIDALLLCLGGRADVGMIREGAARADIVAEFGLTPAASDWLRAEDLLSDAVEEQASQETAGSVILRRTLDRNGKSRAYINQIPVTLQHLKALADHLIDIHGQHAFQTLVKPDEQKRILDEYAGLQTQREMVVTGYDAWQVLVQRLRDAETQAESRTQTLQRLAWLLEEVQKINPQPQEWEQLSQEHHRLGYAAELLAGAQSALQVLEEQDDHLLQQVHQLTQRLDPLSRRDAQWLPIIETLQQAQVLLEEAARDIHQYVRNMDVDAERFAEIDQRVSQWHAAARKLRLEPDALYEMAQQWQQDMADLQQAVDVEALTREVLAAEQVYRREAILLSEQRRAAASGLAESITQAMQTLSMAGGYMDIAVEPSPVPRRDGLDQVEFRVAGHGGVTARSLAKVASGGELARISLAITVICSGASPVPTIIFDEVDSGIGGAVAEVVGRYLRQLGAARQVLCVTHLPQVAAQGHHHWRVSKHRHEDGTVSRIVALNEPERVEEIARMLGGSKISAATREAAREMLGL